VRIGVFHNKPYYLRYYESALVELHERGHHLVLLAPDRWEYVKRPRALKSAENVSTALYPKRRGDGLDQAVEFVRIARDASRYLAPEFRAVSASKELAFRRLADVASVDLLERSDLEWLPQLEGVAASRQLDRAFESLERAIPPDEGLSATIAALDLDLAVSINRVNVGGPQMEPVKCAMALGIPTAMVVYSWDNLSCGGVLHVHPDRLFVWNETMAAEAVELHGYDPARVVTAGAPRFDAMFERRPSLPREELAAELGLEPGHRTILYLGSSKFVAPRESELVVEWSDAVRASSEPRVATANILVRPHPQAVEERIWTEWMPPEGVALTPRRMRDRAQDLYDQLSLADAVVALNTSASIEAAILDKPVLTIKAGEWAPGQEGQLNVEHLLAENGGFVQTSLGFDDHVGQLVEALTADPLAGRRRSFVKSFLRPQGLDRPAGQVLADELEAFAGDRVAQAT
jgi:hypothetical protein